METEKPPSGVSISEAAVRYAADSNWSSLEQANSVANLALSLFALGEYSECIATAQRSLREMPRIEAGLWTILPLLLVGLSLSESDEELARGVTLVAAASKYTRDEGMEETWFLPVLERNERKARTTLGDNGYDAAVRIGEALSRDDAIVFALSPTNLSAADEQAPSRNSIRGGGWLSGSCLPVSTYLVSRRSAVRIAKIDVCRLRDCAPEATPHPLR